VINGQERYPVNVRYFRDFRSDLDSLAKVSIPAAGNTQIPLSQLATIRTRNGPAMIRNENGLLTGYVLVDVAGRSLGDYARDAKRVLTSMGALPAGYSVLWSGQYEAEQRAHERLMIVVPVTLGIVILLLYCNTRSLVKTSIVLLAVPFSAVGAIWMIYLLGYNLSIAVWLGIIALLGVDAETGVFMLLYLDLAYQKARSETQELNRHALYEAIVDGAAKRLRPKFMTFATMIFGLVPLLWSTGAGSEIMKRIAAPMVGGICTSFILELMVYPAIYATWKERQLSRTVRAATVWAPGSLESDHVELLEVR
jgi:Cu(I)/Ag(I) efflux system membrane protein CusA/SilA